MYFVLTDCSSAAYRLYQIHLYLDTISEWTDLNILVKKMDLYWTEGVNIVLYLFVKSWYLRSYL